MYGRPLGHEPADEGWHHGHVRSVAPAGLVLGLSLGGFIDATVIHPIVAWQRQLAETDLTVPANGPWLDLLAEDLFRTAVWVLAVLGSILLWRARDGLAVTGAGSRLLGTVLIGTGLFIAGDGAIELSLAGLSLALSTAAWQWSLGLLCLGTVLAGLGYRVWRSAPPIAD